jgi:hypothetical protein
MTEVKIPDLNAPRFRKESEGTLNKEFIALIRKELASVRDLTDDDIKDIILSFNGNVWKTVVEKRDGVELPEQLGHIFIGTCPAKKSKNVDFKATTQHMKAIQHRNWESDQHLAKIFFTNYGTKYRFKNHELWGFTAVRQFKRTVGQEYPKRWKQYIEVDSTKKISAVYKKNEYYLGKQERAENKIDTYNEFDL